MKRQSRAKKPAGADLEPVLEFVDSEMAKIVSGIEAEHRKRPAEKKPRRTQRAVAKGDHAHAA